VSKRSRKRAKPKRKARREGRRRPSSSAPHPPRREEEIVVDFREEYRYVLADLKRIGILAAVMIGMLLGLSLLLP